MKNNQWANGVCEQIRYTDVMITVSCSVESLLHETVDGKQRRKQARKNADCNFIYIATIHTAVASRLFIWEENPAIWCSHVSNDWWQWGGRTLFNGKVHQHNQDNRAKKKDRKDAVVTFKHMWNGGAVHHGMSPAAWQVNMTSPETVTTSDLPNWIFFTFTSRIRLR